MAFKSSILALAALCCLELAFAQTQYFVLGGGSRRSDDSGERRVVVQQPAVQQVVVRPSYERVVTSYRQRDSNSYENDDAQYQFAYRVRASGKGGYGSGERGYGGDSAEFGHSENRNGARTDGSYFVDLPDGRRQTVEYYVDGGSGYIARVSYGGKGYSAGGARGAAAGGESREK